MHGASIRAVFLGVVLSVLPLQGGKAEGGGEKQAQAQPAELLLQAELLEVSEGDIDNALKIYKRLSEADSVPESIKARALYCRARCWKKLGRIELAGKLLDQLISQYPGEREVARRARLLLKELREGEPRNRKFDWLGELRRDPQVSARIFDYIMDLIGEKEKVEAAYRRLLALGPIALPMLEQVARSSRDPAQRRRLGLILLNLGKFEYVSLALPPQYDYGLPADALLLDKLVRNVLSFPPEKKEQLRAALSADPASGRKGGIRDLLLLASGDRRNIPQKLSNLHLESGKYLLQGCIYAVLESLAKDDQGRKILIERLLDPNVSQRTALIYLGALRSAVPEKLSAAFYAALIASPIVTCGNKTIFEALEKRNGVSLILKSGNPEIVLPKAVCYFSRKYRWVDELKKAPAAWAPVLLAAGKIARSKGNAKLFGESADPLAQLFSMALVNDGAVPSFVSWITSDPRFVDYLQSFQLQRFLRIRPSRAFAEAMAELLDSKDPCVLAFALERLSAAPPTGRPDLLVKLKRLLGSRVDPHLHEFVVYALLQVAKVEKEKVSEVGRILLEDFSRTKDRKFPKELYLRESPLSKDPWLKFGTVNRVKRYRRPEDLKPWSDFCLRWVFKQVPQETVFSLAQSIFSAEVPGGDKEEFYLYLLEHVGERARAAQLARDLTSNRFKDPRSVIRALKLLRDSVGAVRDMVMKGVLGDRFAAYMRSVALDRSGGIPFELRYFAMKLYSEHKKHNWYKWFDWKTFVAGSDPFVKYLLRVGMLDALIGKESPLTEKEKELLVRAGLKSAFPVIRLWSVSVMPHDAEKRAVVEEILKDAEKLFAEAEEVPPQVVLGLWRLRTMGPKVRKKVVEIVASVIRKGLVFPEPWLVKELERGSPEDCAAVAAAAFESTGLWWPGAVVKSEKLFLAIRDFPKALRRIFTGADYQVRKRALDFILKTNDVRVAPALAFLLKDPERRSLWPEIIERLGYIGGAESVEALLGFVKSSDADLRSRALSALKSIRERLSEEAKWRALLEELRSRGNEQLKQSGGAVEQRKKREKISAQ